MCKRYRKVNATLGNAYTFTNFTPTTAITATSAAAAATDPPTTSSVTAIRGTE